MSTLIQKALYARSMNGVITLSDGTLTIQDGNISNANNIQSNYLRTQLLDISSNVIIEGNLTLKNNFKCGDASVDTHTVNGVMTFNNLPESATAPTTVNQLTNKTYVDTNFMFKTGTITETITGIKSFSSVVRTTSTPVGSNDLINISYGTSNYGRKASQNSWTATNFFPSLYINKPDGVVPSNYSIDASGLCNFDNVNSSITLVNPAMTAFTGYTTPVYPTQTTLLNNTNTTTTLNGWTITMGTLGTTIWSNGNNGLEYYGSPAPGYTYHLWNRSYQGTTYTLQQSITLDAGIYILTFWSYWGYQGVSAGGATKGLLTVSVLNSTDTYAYNDSDTRNALTWRQHTFRFTVSTTGSTYIRWTPTDNQVAGTPFPWAITGLILNKYNAIQFTDLTASKSSYVAGNISVLNNAYISNIYGSGTLSLTGTPSFKLGAPNTNCIAISTAFGTAGTPANSNCVMMGLAVGANATAFDRVVGIGYNLNANNGTATRCVLIGSSILTAVNQDVLIGHFVKSGGDTIGQNVAIGSEIGVSTTDTLDGVGVGRRTVAIGTGIFSSTYNGYNLNPSQPNESVAIGFYSQRTCFDNYNTSVGSRSLQNLIGNNNTPAGNGIPAPYLTQYNVALGYFAGQNQQILNQCVFIGANTLPSASGISNATALGYAAIVGADYATSIGSGVSNAVANSVRVGRSNDLVQIDGSLNILGKLSLSGNITNPLTKIDGSLNVFGTQFNLSNLIYPSQAQDGLISAATTLTTPYYQYYSVNAGATAFTITLATITAPMLGKLISFRRVGGTTTTIVSFVGNGTQKVYNTVNTGGAAAQTLMASGVYIVNLVPMVDAVAGTYAYFQF